MIEVIRRLGAPALVLALLVTGNVYGPDGWMSAFGKGGVVAERLFAYVLPIGIWLAGAWLLNRVIGLFFWDRVVRGQLGWTVPKLLRDALAIVIFLGALAGIIADVLDRSLTGLFAASSVMALVIGLALRNVILDIFTGLAINLDRSYQIDDWIEVHHRDFKVDVFGRVSEINWRTTRVELEDGNVVVIPNNVMSTAMTTNFSMPERVARFEVPLALEFGIPTERATRLLLAGVTGAIGPDGPADRPPPKVLVGGTSERGVEYLVRYWMRIGPVPPNTVRSKVMRSILAHLDAASVRPAYPKEEFLYGRRQEQDFERDSPMRRAALLDRVDLLKRSLTDDELAIIAAAMIPQTFRANSSLIRQGQAGQSMFVLAEGLVEVLVKAEDTGRETRVARLDPGQCVGEMSLLTGGPRSATVNAVCDSFAFEICKEHIQPLIEARPEIAETISWLVAERRLRTLQALADASPDMASEETDRLSAQILGRMRAFFRGVRETRRVG